MRIADLQSSNRFPNEERLFTLKSHHWKEILHQFALPPWDLPATLVAGFGDS